MTTIAGGAQMGPDAGSEAGAHELIEVRRRRAELYESITSLEHALAAPVPGRQKRWATRVAEAQEELSDDFRDHVVLMEGPEGLNVRLIRRAPRLAQGRRSDQGTCSAVRDARGALHLGGSRPRVHGAG